MAVEQHYSLRWNDYTVKIVTAFQSLRDEEDFVDVTIACDGHHYSAHKMVLSACSPYFRSLLKANPCQHPIVILKDVGHLEMERLLEFMYNGEVNIAQDQLAAFLKTAEGLKIRGLAGSSDDLEQSHQSQKDLAHAYTACLQQGVISDHSNTSNFSGLSGCKEDLINDGVFNTSPPTKRRKRTFDGNSIQQDTSLHSGNLAEANLIEDRVETTDNGGIDLEDDPRLERSELKSEPNEHLTEVYTDSSELNADGQHYEAIDQRSIVYPISTVPGTSGSQVSNQENVGPNSQDNGAAPGGAVCEALNLSLRPPSTVTHVNGPTMNGSHIFPASVSIQHHYQLQNPANERPECLPNQNDELDFKVSPSEFKINPNHIMNSMHRYPELAMDICDPDKREDAAIISVTGAHEYKTKLYPCPECHKVFRHPMSLHHHRHVHKGTYTCHSCGKVFSRRWDLHRHIHRSKMGCRRPNHTIEPDHQYEPNPPSN